MQIFQNGGGVDIDTDGTLAANSDVKVASQKATKTYVDTGLSGKQNTLSLPLSIANGGTGQTAKTAAFDALSPNTTKGDITVHNGTNNVRQAVGSYGQVLVADSSQSGGVKWATVSGGINYVTNSDAEGNATTGFATYADAAGTSPVDATGGSPTTTFTTTSTNPLRGTYSFLITKDAANRQGEGVSYAITIDPADQAKVLTIEFDYSIASGTYADGDLSVWVYDVTNSQLIQPAPYKIQNAGGINHWKGEFQTNSNSTSYRVAWHVSSTSASAYTVALDNISVGPGKKVFGAPVTDTGASAWTPTGSWSTNTTYTGKYSRIGDRLFARVNVATTGAPTSATLTINLPPGLTIDTSKLDATVQYGTSLHGDGKGMHSGTGYIYGPVYNNTTSIAVVSGSISTAGAAALVTQASPFTFGNGDNISLSFVVCRLVDLVGVIRHL